MENADPTKTSAKVAPEPPKTDHPAEHPVAHAADPKSKLHVIKRLGKEAAIGIFVALVVGGGGWTGSTYLPQALDYGCSTSSEAALARGYRALERKDPLDARREAEDVIIVQPGCAKAHALDAEAAAALMGTGPTLDENLRRLARQEGATAERLGFRSDEIDAVLAVTEVINTGA